MRRTAKAAPQKLRTSQRTSGPCPPLASKLVSSTVSFIVMIRAGI